MNYREMFLEDYFDDTYDVYEFLNEAQFQGLNKAQSDEYISLMNKGNNLTDKEKRRIKTLENKMTDFGNSRTKESQLDELEKKRKSATGGYRPDEHEKKVQEWERKQELQARLAANKERLEKKAKDDAKKKFFNKRNAGIAGGAAVGAAGAAVGATSAVKLAQLKKAYKAGKISKDEYNRLKKKFIVGIAGGAAGIAGGAAGSVLSAKKLKEAYEAIYVNAYLEEMESLEDSYQLSLMEDYDYDYDYYDEF